MYIRNRTSELTGSGSSAITYAGVKVSEAKNMWKMYVCVKQTFYIVLFKRYNADAQWHYLRFVDEYQL